MLKENLKEWTDIDIAMFFIAKELGIIGDKDFHETKWVYNTKNRFSDALWHILEELEQSGILEKNEDDFYRWNQKFEIKPNQ
jgi:hypothetical protein